jgi:ABC-type amino acid transport substrate-binding protein
MNRYASGVVSALKTALLMGVCALFVPPLSARPLDEVTDSGEITIFVYSDYAPYSYMKDGEAVGIDVEIAGELASALGVKLNLLMRGADENLDDDLRINIWKGDLIHRKVADVMLHVPADPEVDYRNEFAVLMGGYFQETMGVVYDADKIPELKTFGRFVSQPIGVELDTAADFFLSGAFRGKLMASVRRGRTFKEAVALYTEGEVPALLASRAQAEWVATQAPLKNSVIAQPPMPGMVRSGWPIGIAIKHDSRDLGYTLTDVLSEMQQSGKLQSIYERYGVTYLPPIQ